MKQRVFTVSPLLFTLMLKKVYKKKGPYHPPPKIKWYIPPTPYKPFWAE